MRVHASHVVRQSSPLDGKFPILCLLAKIDDLEPRKFRKLRAVLTRQLSNVLDGVLDQVRVVGPRRGVDALGNRHQALQLRRTQPASERHAL